ncbi:MAG: YqjF family protein [Thermoanaerobaculia bacterium]
MSHLPAGRPFLSAEWRHLLMLNYAVDPELLAPFVPAGTVLDPYGARTLASVVGFLFLDTRVLGLGVPLHRDFEEVNLRFYVRREAPDGVRRGVVFVREIVPRRAIAWTARALYNENYVALPMRHEITDHGASGERSVEYAWKLAGRWSRLRGAASGEAEFPLPGSEEEFVSEHYWGYARQRDGGTVEYRVEHPRWTVRPATGVSLDADLAALYGPAFREPLAAPPVSAFLADGSPVLVHRGTRIAGSVAGGRPTP